MCDNGGNKAKNGLEDVLVCSLLELLHRKQEGSCYVHKPHEPIRYAILNRPFDLHNCT